MPPKKDKPDIPLPLEGQVWQRINQGGEVDNVRVVRVFPNKKDVLVTDMDTGTEHKVALERFLPEHGWRLYAHGWVTRPE